MRRGMAGIAVRVASAVARGARIQPERAPSLIRARAGALRQRPPAASILATARSVPNICRLARDLGTGRRPGVATFASAADRDPPPPPTEEDVEAATRKWLDETVIGLNLCPFARAPRARPGGIAIRVSRARTPDDLFAEFTAEAKRLAKTYTDADAAYGEEDDDADDASTAEGLSEPETTLLVAPNVREMGQDFILFLAVVERCDAILEELDLVGHIQLASFHPHYQFEGEEVADPGSYTNRSPYPTVHLLRAVDVSRAVDAHPDTETIPVQNVEKLRTIGRERLYDTLESLIRLRVDSTEETKSSNEARLDRAKAAVEKAVAGDEIAKTLFETSDVDRAKSQVLRFLNYKPRTRAELRKKLIDDKLYDPEVADEALDHLQRTGVQSDVDYAEQFGRMKWRTSKWAPAQIRVELKRRGIHERDAREGLSRVFGDDVNAVGESDGYVRRGTVFEVRREARALGEESADDDKSYELFLASRKRWALTDGMDSEKRRRRLIGWLQRRGHAMSLIQRIVDSLEAEDERAKYE